MKLMLSLLAMFPVFLLPVSGQEKPVMQQDPLAEPVLDQLAALFSTEKAFHIEFRYEVESTADDYKVEDYGSAIIKGNMYKLKLDDGEVIFNGSKIWSYNPVNQEVYVSTPDPENMDQMLVVPFTLLTKYREFFKYKLKGESKIGSMVYYDIDLYPINLECSYSILKLQTEKTSGRLHSFSLQQKNGVMYKVFLTELIQDVKISEDTFNWKKELYPEVLIIEL